MSLFDKTVECARDYKSFAAELYVSRMLRQLGLSKADLTRDNLRELINAVKAEPTTGAEEKKRQQFIEAITALLW